MYVRFGIQQPDPERFPIRTQNLAALIIIMYLRRYVLFSIYHNNHTVYYLSPRHRSFCLSLSSQTEGAPTG